jgi:TP901 family phage tail tape measure protein
MSVKSDVINLNINVNNNAAQESLNKLRKSAADVRFEMDGLKKGTAEYAAKKAELAAINQEMSNLKQTIGLTALTQKELIRELNQLKALKSSVQPFTKEFKDLQIQIEKVESRLYDVKNGVQGLSSYFSKMSDEVKQFGVMAAGYLGFQFITSQIGNIIGGAGKLSDSLADIRRVTGMTAEEVEHLNHALSGLDTRTSTGGLREIAVIAGKLGVAKEDILGFVQATDKLVVSLGDELGNADEITTQLGKIINVYANADADGKVTVTGDKLMNIGNAIVHMANAGVASGGFIVDFTQRLGGLAKTAHVGLNESIGLAAGLEESGQKAESSSTAIIKVLAQMGTDVPKFAGVAKMSIADFSATLRDKPMEALIRVSEGFTKGKGSFEELSKAFANAGEDGAKIVTTLGIIGGKADFFRGKIKDAGDTLSKTNEINDAFELKNQTLGATLDKLGKEFNKMFTSNAVTGFLKDAAIGTYNLIIWLKDLPNWLEKNRTSIIAVTTAVLAFMASKLQLTTAAVASRVAIMGENIVFAAQYYWLVISTTATKAYAFVKGVLKGEITLATAAQQLWNLALKQNPIMWVVMAVGLLATGISYLVDKTKELTAAQRMHNDLAERSAELARDEEVKARTLWNQLQQVNLTLDEKKKKLQELIALNPDYLKGLTLENLKTQEGLDILKNYIEKLRESYREKARGEMIMDREKKMSELEVKTKSLEKAPDKKGNLFADLGAQLGIGNGSSGYQLIQAQQEMALLKNELNALYQDTADDIKKSATNAFGGGKATGTSPAEGLIAKLKREISEQEKLLPDLTNKSDIDANLKKTKELQEQLDKLMGKKDKGGKKEESEFERLTKELITFKAEVEKVRRDNEIDGKTEDQKEIARIEKKYADLLAQAQAYLVKVHHLKNGKGKQLEAGAREGMDALAQQEVIELDRANKKQFENSSTKEYEQALKDSENYFEGLKKLQAERFAAGIINEKTYQANITAIDAEAAKDQINVANDYSAVVKKAATDLTKLKSDELKKQTADLIAQLRAQEAERKLLEQMHSDGKEASIKRRTIINKPGTSEYDAAEKELLAFEKQKALKVLQLKRYEARKGLEDAKMDEFEKVASLLQIDKDYEAQKDLLDAEYSAKEKESRDKQIDEIKKGCDTAIAMFSQLNSLISNLENAQLNREIANNDRKKAALKKHLDGKLINERQYQKEVERMDTAQEKKRKEIAREQAKREKAINLFSAVVNTAAAIAKALPNIPLSILAGVMGGLQIATIAASPLPELGTGDWIRKGDKHSDPSGGIVAKIERDEAVMKAAAMTSPNTYTVTGTTAQITSALNSLAGGVNWAGGAQISMPNAKAQQINPSMPRIMEQGGVVRPLFSANGNSSGIDGIEKLHAEMASMHATLANFNTKLHAVVSIKEYRREEAKYEAAKKASSLNQ